MSNAESTGVYQRLCDLAEIDPIESKVDLSAFTSPEDLANKSLAQRITAALQVFVELTAGDESTIKQVDKVMIDKYIAKNFLIIW